MKQLPILLILAFLPATLWAQDPAPQAASFEEKFGEAAALYRQAKYSEASKMFAGLAGSTLDNVSALTNWGLSSYQEGRKGLAVGLWRRALVVDPTADTPRRALDFASRAMQLQGPEDTTWFDRLEHRFLGHVLLDQLLGASLVLLVLGGFPVVTYLGRRRKALRDEQPLPNFSIAGGLLTAVCLIMLVLAGFKAFEFTTSRATAVANVSVRTGPDEQSSALFDLREGADVVVRQAKKGWTQIRHPGGMSGWVPQDTLFQTSGMPLW